MSRYLPAQHPLSRVYRSSAALFGIGLDVFGVLGFAYGLPYLDTHGVVVMGLSSNGTLSLISVVVGTVLVVAAVVGGALASTVMAVIGGLFVLSGLVNLAVLDTPLNLLAFRIQNVIFSLVAGIVLLYFGLYGRVSGGLSEDNPYVRHRRHEEPDVDHTAEYEADRVRLAEIAELADAEQAVAMGHATPEQERLVYEDSRQRAEDARREAYRRARLHEQPH